MSKDLLVDLDPEITMNASFAMRERVRLLKSYRDHIVDSECMKWRNAALWRKNRVMIVIVKCLIFLTYDQSSLLVVATVVVHRGAFEV